MPSRSAVGTSADGAIRASEGELVGARVVAQDVSIRPRCTEDVSAGWARGGGGRGDRSQLSARGPGEGVRGHARWSSPSGGQRVAEERDGALTRANNRKSDQD